DSRPEDRELPSVSANAVECEPARQLRHAGSVRRRHPGHADLRGKRSRRFQGDRHHARRAQLRSVSAVRRAHVPRQGPDDRADPPADAAAHGSAMPLPLLRILRPDGTPAGAPRAQARPDERCEMCGVPMDDDHRHIVDMVRRSLMCVCRPCGLLFVSEGAGGGRFRAGAERYFRLEADLDAPWELMNIPVGIAFFFVNSSLGRAAALYPSPAGATESLLPLEAWPEFVARHPLLATLAPDVEAVLLRRMRGVHESFIVPIDACYELAGLVRRHWKGFDGGEEAGAAIDRFFDRIRERSDAFATAATP